MQTPSDTLVRGRAAFEERAWTPAYESLRSADREGPIAPDDLGRLAVAAYLVGRNAEFEEALERAHHGHLESGQAPAAVRAAFWLGMHLAERGELARATGWFGRAGRILERVDAECPERGLMLLPRARRELEGGDPEAAYSLAGDAARMAARYDDRDLLALAVHVQGRARIVQNRIEDGLALLDEAMVAVATDRLSPIVTGLIYCSVIGACRSVYALRRAREWTGALAEWCDRQPDMVAYAGECGVYRAEVMRLRGHWDDAFAAVRTARERFPSDAPRGAVSLAHYHQGDLHRLRGEFEAAEETYRAAAALGRDPQPGLALLRLAQGRPEAAAAGLRRALAEGGRRPAHARLLAAQVEATLALGEADEAEEAERELTALATACETDVLGYMAAQASGTLALHEGDAEGALPPLRDAARGWGSLGAPYEAACARVLLGRACRGVGDDDAATLELNAARETFEALGATPDLERLDALTARAAGAPARGAHGLTPREREVLALVATGRTNREVAHELKISDKTVARHVANIFQKLGLSTRSAATAYAYEHDLLLEGG